MNRFFLGRCQSKTSNKTFLSWKINSRNVCMSEKNQSSFSYALHSMQLYRYNTKLYVWKYWIIFSFLGRKSVVCPRLGTWQMKVASQKWWRRAHVAAGRRLALPSPRRSSSRRRGEAFIAQRTVIWWRKRRQNEQRLYSAHTGATSFFPHYFQSKSLYTSLAMSYLYLSNCTGYSLYRFVSPM